MKNEQCINKIVYLGKLLCHMWVVFGFLNWSLIMTGIFKGKNEGLALIFELYKKISLFWKLILLISCLDWNSSSLHKFKVKLDISNIELTSQL